MRKNGRLQNRGVIHKDPLLLKATHLKDEAKRLLDVYLETFQEAPESDFLLTRIIHQPEKSIKASTFDVRVAPSPAASQAHHEPTLSP